MKITDTHVHVWDLDRAAYPWLNGDSSILNRTWRIDELQGPRLEAGITTAVMVQASGNPEDTELMLEVARSNDWVGGVVGWLPLMDPAATARLLEKKFLGDEYFKGARHQIHDEPDAAWLLQPAVIESLKILAAYDIPFDIVAVQPAHITAALAVAQRVPRLRMVFDHLAQPPIASQERFGKWGDLMKAAAQLPCFHAKISGLGTASGRFTGRTNSDIAPYVFFALQEFGTQRCFCGGDWPVSMLAKDYVATWQMYRDILTPLLSEEEREKVFYSNALSFYNITT